jgi:hypothetical protein
MSAPFHAEPQMLTAGAAVQDIAAVQDVAAVVHPESLPF